MLRLALGWRGNVQSAVDSIHPRTHCSPMCERSHCMEDARIERRKNRTESATKCHSGGLEMGTAAEVLQVARRARQESEGGATLVNTSAEEKNWYERVGMCSTT